VYGLPMTEFFAGTATGRVDALVDDCGRYVVPDLDANTADVAIVIEAAGYRRTTTLLVGRTTVFGADRDVEALAVTEATATAWATQLDGAAPPDVSAGILVRYTMAGAPRSGMLVAKDGETPMMNPAGTPPWASYFTGDAAFGSLDPTHTATQASGTALTVIDSTNTILLEGFRQGGGLRCGVAGIQQVANTLIYVTIAC
jgi:hypothetical protein